MILLDINRKSIYGESNRTITFDLEWPWKVKELLKQIFGGRRSIYCWYLLIAYWFEHKEICWNLFATPPPPHPRLQRCTSKDWGNTGRPKSGFRPQLLNWSHFRKHVYLLLLIFFFSQSPYPPSRACNNAVYIRMAWLTRIPSKDWSDTGRPNPNQFTFYDLYTAACKCLIKKTNSCRTDDILFFLDI